MIVIKQSTLGSCDVWKLAGGAQHLRQEASHACLRPIKPMEWPKHVGGERRPFPQPTNKLRTPMLWKSGTRQLPPEQAQHSSSRV